MGACVARANDPAAIKSKAIDTELKKYHNRHDTKVKLLLLGPGESGKSTVFKQMKLIQDQGGFTKAELALFKTVVFSNCLSQMRELIQAAATLQLPFSSEEGFKMAQKLLVLPPHAWSTEIGNLIKTVWADTGVKEVYKLRGKKFHLNDTAKYFFDNIDRFIDPSYEPTNADVLRARVRTTGIDEAEFTFDNTTMTIVDVGGQRSERRKWLHCFDSVTAVVFCASLSDYDEKLREDISHNRMAVALLLFDEIVNSHFFKRNSIILFLNKTDLFEDKIRKTPITVFFEDYKGNTTDVESSKKFIKEKFVEQVKDQAVYTHFTCALNTENIQFVIKSVRDTILRDTLEELGVAEI